MKLQKNYIVASSVFLLSAVSLFSQTAYVRTTTNANPWVDSGAKAGTAWATLTIVTSKSFLTRNIRRYRDSAAASRKKCGMP